MTQDIFIYNHYRKCWDRIEDNSEYFTMGDIRTLLRGEIIKRSSGARYKIDELVS